MLFGLADKKIFRFNILDRSREALSCLAVLLLPMN